MACLTLHLGVVWIISIVATGFAASCNEKQLVNNAGGCCDLCPPGKYMKEICSESQKTTCGRCEKGYYSKGYTPLPCVQCTTCQHDYVRNCTPTTDAACSCRPGFLCSDKVCSKCLLKQCSKGDQAVERHGKIENSYECEPCPDNTYSDTNDGNCKTLTQCSANGMMTVFPGNKTHNAMCQILVKGGDGDPTKVILTVGFVTIAFAFLIFLSFLIHAYIKNSRKRKNKNSHAADGIMLSPELHQCSLSKEESGGQFIHQAESSDDDSATPLSLKHIAVC